MVVFVTLFLELVVGMQTVELAVSEPVAAVELRLGDRRVGVLRDPPWTMECDLGSELRPQRLVAVAYDASEREVHRAEQWINLPQPRSQVELLPVTKAGETPRSVRLLWRSADAAQPDALRVTFDGEVLELGDPRLVELPPYDPREIHLLKAELAFGRSLASAEMTLGGPASDVVGTDLTAFPVLLAKGRKLPSREQMTGWFRHAGRPLRVVAIDRGPADVVMVQDQSPHLQGQLQRLHREVLGFSGVGVSPTPRPSGIQHGDRLRVVVPFALPADSAEGRPRELFPISADLAAVRQGPRSVGVGSKLIAAPAATGILQATFHAVPPAGAPQRLADAVAEAGRVAAAGRRPRVVIVVTGPDPQDRSRFSPVMARSYLRQLQVPLLVWSPETRGDRTAWGESEVIRGRSELFRAVRSVRSLLDRQIVVWLEGRHLPQEIELAETAGARLEALGDYRPAPPEAAPPLPADAAGSADAADGLCPSHDRHHRARRAPAASGPVGRGRPQRLVPGAADRKRRGFLSDRRFLSSLTPAAAAAPMRTSRSWAKVRAARVTVGQTAEARRGPDRLGSPRPLARTVGGRPVQSKGRRLAAFAPSRRS